MTKPTLAEFLAKTKERWREHAVVKCPSCFGDGGDMEDSSRPCDECNGDGVVREGPELTLADARADLETLLNMVEAIHDEAVYPARSFRELGPGEYIDAVALERALEELVPEGGACASPSSA